MIFYFSGTGNSRHAARRLGHILEEEINFIPATNPLENNFKGNSLGLVFPVYAWGVPPIVVDFINKLPQSFINKCDELPVWVVMTCGDETGNTPLMIRDILDSKGLKLMAGWSVIMPNVYVLLPGFDVDSKEIEIKKTDNAIKRIDAIGEKISHHQWEFDYTYGSMPHLKTSLIYPLFKRWGIKSSKFHWDKECIRCGKCALVCPVGNISIRNEHPTWGNKCTSCLACYHSCPVKAIQYGRLTSNKGQYYCHLK